MDFNREPYTVSESYYRLPALQIKLQSHSFENNQLKLKRQDFSRYKNQFILDSLHKCWKIASTNIIIMLKINVEPCLDKLPESTYRGHHSSTTPSSTHRWYSIVVVFLKTIVIIIVSLWRKYKGEKSAVQCFISKAYIIIDIFEKWRGWLYWFELFTVLRNSHWFFYI